MIVKPFAALRPQEEYAKECAALPYDVMSSDEAREEVKGKPYSFLHIDKAEIDLDPSVDLYDDSVYQKAADNLREFEKIGVYAQDTEKKFYFYRQIPYCSSRAASISSFPRIRPSCLVSTTSGRIAVKNF